ncbi:hypothetical protein [Conexibacter sp. CPCC 206217]|uniref:hypothetical protein n=1 Tax=Conexibacter sp. CPCC 206217 TaxID=3064574 RepID=UPI0027157702|nr:hypothetical protein [Conexibacter sp. CPCC 206217]MDO8208995.1 hypothetical protein [Conexibacter sp. CPCC 206217]
MAPVTAILGLPSPDDIIQDGVKSAFDFVVKTLFGSIPTKVTEAAISWQLHLPSEAFTNSNLVELKNTTTAAAFALLGLVMTTSALRYWLAGFVDGGTGAEALNGVTKTIAAALGVLAWPWAFNASITLVNDLTSGLIHSQSVHDDVSRMLGAAVGISIAAGPVGTFASIVLVIAGTLLMLGLFSLHIVLACALSVIFVGGPLLIVLWPYPGTAWLSTLAFRAFGTLLCWPVIWALCFAAFAAVFQDVLNFRGDGGVLDKALIKPLTGVAMLYLCVRLPMLATRATMSGIASGGAVAFAARYVAVRQVARAGEGLLSSGSRSERGASERGARRGSAGANGGARGAAAARGAATAAGAPAIASAAPAAAREAAGVAAVPRSDGRSPAPASSGRPRTEMSGPAGIRSLGARPAELTQQMERARTSRPSSSRDVEAALGALDPRQVTALGAAHDRAVAAGSSRDEALGAVTRAAAVGAARAEQAGDSSRVQAYTVAGSASSPAFVGALESYRAAQTSAPPTSAGAGAPPARRPLDPPAPQQTDSPSPTSHRPEARS